MIMKNTDIVKLSGTMPNKTIPVVTPKQRVALTRFNPSHLHHIFWDYIAQNPRFLIWIIAVREIVNFSNTIFFRHTNE